MNIYIYPILGLAIGSLLSLCVYRMPRGESIWSRAPHCPHCNEKLRLFDNLPVLSFLLLRGRCRFCRQRISLQYPAIELLTMLAFLACFAQWGWSPTTLVNSIFLAVIIALIFTDYNHRILPNALTIPAIFVGIVLSRYQVPIFFHDAISYKLSSILPGADANAWLPWVGSCVGAMIGSAFPLFTALAFQALRGRKALGMGDVKMLAMVGAFLGWRLALLTLFVGSLLASGVGILLILFGGRTLQSKLPFGAFLGPAAALALFSGAIVLQ
jgi:leader peptidase (prepilin peptidase)/N-methyltransferase